MDVRRLSLWFTASEPQDHSFTDSPMHVIYARGQEQGNYIHSPSSGIETGQARMKMFYRTDELKYHGHSSQRGTDIINFVGKLGPVSTAVGLILGLYQLINHRCNILPLKGNTIQGPAVE